MVEKFILTDDIEAVYDADAKQKLFDTFRNADVRDLPEMTIPAGMADSLRLIRINIQDVTRVGFAKSANTQVEFYYEDLSLNDYTDNLKMVGTLEEGLNDMYFDGPLHGSDALRLFTHIAMELGLDKADLVPVNYGEIEFMGKPVRCILKIPLDKEGMKSALELMDKFLEHEAELDLEARMLLTSNLGMHMDELRSVIGEPDISVDDVKTELVPKAACFSVEGEFELTYYLYGSQKNMVGSVYGKYGVGLLTYMIEYVD